MLANKLRKSESSAQDCPWNGPVWKVPKDLEAVSAQRLVSPGQCSTVGTPDSVMRWRIANPRMSLPAIGDVE